MIIINLNKAKTIAHEKRRAKRSEEFAPLDEKIMKQIPGTNIAEVEAQRQLIRDKYDMIQEKIDRVRTVEGLTKILNSLEENK